MIPDDMLAKLKYAREKPARMIPISGAMKAIQEYLDEHAPFHEWKAAHRIDYILEGKPTCPLCAKPKNPRNVYCSSYCRANDPINKDRVSKTNKANVDTRMKALKNTLMERYGVTAVQDIPESKIKTKASKQPGYDKIVRNTFERYGVDYEKMSDLNFLSEHCRDKSLIEISKEYFNGMCVMAIRRHFSKIGYTHVNNSRGSRGQREVAEYIESIGFHVEQNNRNICEPYELDIVVHGRAIAIEYNGNYWHLNDEKPVMKANLCASKGYSLMTIFEDEWEFSSHIVKSIICDIFGVYSVTIDSSACICRSVGKKVAEEFFGTNDISDFKHASCYFGLFNCNELVSVIGVVKSQHSREYKYEVVQFANKLNINVENSLNSLLSYTKKSLCVDTLLMYVDRRYVNQERMSHVGVLLGYGEANYYWIHTDDIFTRLNKRSTNKKNLPKLLGVKFDPKKTEVQNMEDAGYYRIFDCGTMSFKV